MHIIQWRKQTYGQDQWLSGVWREGWISEACRIFKAVKILWMILQSSVSSVAQSCPTLCDSTDCSTPGFLVHHQLPELTQTHVHPVSDAAKPSHPHIIMHLSKSTEGTPRVNPEVNCGLWGMMTCQSRCILCNNCTVLVRDVDNGGDCAYTGSGNTDIPPRCRGFSSRHCNKASITMKQVTWIFLSSQCM